MLHVNDQMCAAFTEFLINACSCFSMSKTPVQCVHATNIFNSFDRSSVDEEVAPLDEGASDDDVLANTSDEENDSSSISSKGDPEQPEESQVKSRFIALVPGSV